LKQVVGTLGSGSKGNLHVATDRFGPVAACRTGMTRIATRLWLAAANPRAAGRPSLLQKLFDE